MKYSIFGFSQAKLIELGMGIDEAAILRYFIDYKDSGKMITHEDNGQTYFWLKYEGILECYPILKISKDMVYRKLKGMVKAGILKHKTVRECGTYSFYGISEKYIELIDDGNTLEKISDKVGKVENPPHSENITTPTENIPNPSEKIPDPYGKNSVTPREKIPYPYGKNSGTKDSSINNSSIKQYSSIKNIDINICTRIVNYLNSKLGTKYRANSNKTQQCIKARFKEGFTEEDFITVIDKKVKQWLGTEWESYLRPETLFGNKFEGYLNQKVVAATKNNAKQQGNFCNYEQREYDFEDIEKKLLGWDQDV